MARITGVNSAGLTSFGNNLYSKRQTGDNSEIYISSKLSKIYQQTVADCFVASKLNSIREFANKKQGA